jgi:NAD+ synthase
MPHRRNLNLDRIFHLDLDAEVTRISDRIVRLLRTALKRRGLVVAMSGGVDSSVACALSVNAVGPERVFGLLMPETDSSPDSLDRGESLCRQLKIDYRIEDISSTLEAIGCYRWRDEAIHRVFPDYEPGWRSKIAIGGGPGGGFSFFKLIVEAPDGRRMEARLGSREYLQIVAATNFKQRVRKIVEYFHADRLHYAVVGTPNRVEFDQGFFVKNGDGSADLKPIAHLYKTQVFMLAQHLDLGPAITQSTPTTDTYSLPQGQDEFYFSLPYEEVDVALWHLNENKPPAELAQVLGISDERAEAIYQDIRRKRLTTASLHWPAIPVETVVGPLPPPTE